MRQSTQRCVNNLAIICLLLLGILVISSRAVCAQANEYCPVTTSEKADPNIYLDYNGQRIHFCCQKCKRDFLADPEQYLANVQMMDSGSYDDSAHSATKPTEAEQGNGHVHDHTEPDSDSTRQSAHSLNSDKHDNSNENSNHVHDLESGSTHNHATDHGDSTNIIAFLGKLHPVVVHFPIALVFMALIFVATRLVLRVEIFDQMAVITIYWAAIFALVAALLGLARSAGSTFPTTLESYFEWHRLLGLISAGTTMITALVGYYWRKGGSSRRKVMFMILLVLNTIIIGITGHLGATLVFGPNYYG